MKQTTPTIAARPLRVLALGAGVQSTALALMMHAGEIPAPDFALFADTQGEPRGVYEHLKRLKEWLRLKTSDPESFARAVAFEREAQAVNATLTDPLRSTPWLTDRCEPLESIDFAALVAGRPASSRSGVSRNTCGGLCGS